MFIVQVRISAEPCPHRLPSPQAPASGPPLGPGQGAPSGDVANSLPHTSGNPTKFDESKLRKSSQQEFSPELCLFFLYVTLSCSNHFGIPCGTLDAQGPDCSPPHAGLLRPSRPRSRRTPGCWWASWTRSPTGPTPSSMACTAPRGPEAGPPPSLGGENGSSGDPAGPSAANSRSSPAACGFASRHHAPVGTLSLPTGRHPEDSPRIRTDPFCRAIFPNFRILPRA